MANMSYCRFRNTLEDLRDCQENIDLQGDMDPDEMRAQKKLIQICCQIAAEYGEEDED